MNRHLIHYLRSPEIQSINYGSVGMRSEDSGPCSEIPSLYHPKQKLTFNRQVSGTHLLNPSSQSLCGNPRAEILPEQS